ncbi:CTP synthase [Trichinella spiralis]|uniref:CTP synthase n=1 Tax=Trichinella spiralis TaxID=6334 RepID=A0ABR3KIG3_TRISP
MSDVREKNIDSFIISKNSSPTSSNSESAQRESDSSESLMQKSDSKQDSSLGSLCATDEYPRLDVPIEHEKQCYVMNYKLKTPAGKFYRYNGPFPPDPKILEELDSQDISNAVVQWFSSVARGFPGKQINTLDGFIKERSELDFASVCGGFTVTA